MSTPETLASLQEKTRQNYAFDVRMANKSVITGSGSPERIGQSLFSHGIRYGAVLRDLEPALPFFEGSRLAFELAIQRAPKTPHDGTVYDTLSQRFTMNFGLFASAALLARREEPADPAPLLVALSARQMAFTDAVFQEARTKPANFRNIDFATVLLTFLALQVAARFWGIDAGALDERIPALPLPKSFERIREPLVALLRDPSAEAALDAYRRAFRAVIHPGAFAEGLLAGIRFVDAYALSIVKERGRLTSALVNLFDAPTTPP